jgi:hypothetical protein
MRHLARFAISPRDEDFVIRLEDEAGEKLEFCASPEQLDAVIDALDEMLTEHEEEYFGLQDRGAPIQRLI